MTNIYHIKRLKTSTTILLLLFQVQVGDRFRIKCKYCKLYFLRAFSFLKYNKHLKKSPQYKEYAYKDTMLRTLGCSFFPLSSSS